jgi:VIT1/CCC1 family predicted Fe2+/Mn2+ transporter
LKVNDFSIVLSNNSIESNDGRFLFKKSIRAFDEFPVGNSVVIKNEFATDLTQGRRKEKKILQTDILKQYITFLVGCIDSCKKHPCLVEIFDPYHKIRYYMISPNHLNTFGCLCLSNHRRRSNCCQNKVPEGPLITSILSTLAGSILPLLIPGSQFIMVG